MKHEVAVSTQSTGRKQSRRGYLRIEPETVEGQLDVSWSHYSTFKEKFSYPLLFQVVETLTSEIEKP